MDQREEKNRDEAASRDVQDFLQQAREEAHEDTQHIASSQLATDWGDSTSSISLTPLSRWALYRAGPRSANPVGWNRLV